MLAFIKGMGSINLFPQERNNIDLSTIALTNEEAFKKDQEAIGVDMWNAVEIMKNKYPECNE